MKKRFYFNIFVSATALMGAMVFTSCGQDDVYSETNAERIANDKYAAAFEKAFGKVGSDVDWGFSTKASTRTRAASNYTSSKGNIQPTINFPTDCDASEFNPDLTNIPSYGDYLNSIGTQWYTPTEITGYAAVYIDEVQGIKMNGGTEEQRAKLYIKAGTYDFTNVQFEIGKLVDVYLLDGATLILNNTAASTAKFGIYIARGAELIANGEDG